MPLYRSDHRSRRACPRDSASNGKNAVSIIDAEDAIGLLEASHIRKIYKRLLRLDPRLQVTRAFDRGGAHFEVTFSDTYKAK